MRSSINKLLFIPIAAVLLFFVQPAHAESITEFATKAVVDKTATVKVEERIDYDFGSLSRHGIYRFIPTVKTNNDGKHYKMDISVLSVTDENNRPYNYTTTTTGANDDLQIKIGDASTYVSGHKTYIITYDVAGAITYFSDHDEFYWNMTGNSWEVPITKATYEVDLPQSVPAPQVKQACYTGIAGSKGTNCLLGGIGIENAGQTTVPLAANEGLTAVVSFPPGYVAHVEPQAVVNFTDTTLGKLVMALLAVLALLWYIGLPVAVPVIWLLYGRDPQGVAGPVSAWFDPPKAQNGRTLTPGETGLLIDETVDVRDIFATIVHLAQRGYLKIVEKNKGDFYFVMQKDYVGDAALTDFELKLLEGVFSGENKSLGLMDALSDAGQSLLNKKQQAAPGEIRIKTLNMATEVSEATAMLYKEMTTGGFFPQNPNTVRTVWYILAGIAVFTGSFLLGVELFIFGRIMPRKTRFGKEQANVAVSLKNFLGTQERQLEFQAKNQMFFEKLLPYAIAFGVEKVWADRFKDIQLHSPDWYQPYQGNAFTTAYLLSSMNSSFSSFRTAATPTRSTSGFSSGFGGGGFSGGGGGGGGGGSW